MGGSPKWLSHFSPGPEVRPAWPGWPKSAPKRANGKVGSAQGGGRPGHCPVSASRRREPGRCGRRRPRARSNRSNYLAKVDVLVLDDWALSAVEGISLETILDVIDDRTGKRSTIVTSQAPVAKWHDMFGDPSTADALLDRILGQALEIKLKGESIRRTVKKSTPT